jgi:hypothetical protein
MKSVSIRWYAGTTVAVLSVLLAAPARAQYKPRPLNDPATGESFHIEFGAGIWSPSSSIQVASAGSGALSGIPGTVLDAQQDLGFSDQRLPAISLVLHPAAAHKFRFDYVPISFSGDSSLARTIDFNGQRYRVGLPLSSALDFKAFRFGYEYDFIRRTRGYGGFILEAKYTDIRVDVNAPGISEYQETRAPIPALGGIARFYVVPSVSLTAEVTGFTLFETIDNKYGGHYFDIDAYATYNFTNNFGAQGGFRSLDMGYLIKQDSGSFVLRGIYFGVVARY